MCNNNNFPNNMLPVLIICITICFPIVVVISGMGSRHCSEFEKIWTVVKSEDVFFFLFEIIVERTLFSKFLCH